MVAGREGWREEVVREPGINMYPLLDLKWITRDFPGGPGVKNALCNAEACSEN